MRIYGKTVSGFAWVIASMFLALVLAGRHVVSAGVGNVAFHGQSPGVVQDTVTVYTAWPKGKPYRVVCWLSGEGAGADMVFSLIQRSRAAGADGLILMGRSGHPSFLFNGKTAAGNHPLEAVAVKFKSKPVVSAGLRPE